MDKFDIDYEVKELRNYEKIFKGDRIDGNLSVIFKRAADTIEALSAKLAAANEERSEDCEEELSRAKEVIRKLLCSEYGSSCQFCMHGENKNAMCVKIGGSGSWCCENAMWNGKTE